MPKKSVFPKFSKPPVVTIMGHVDHGKTTLLDFIRKSRLTSKESGGITQHIGAYQIRHKNSPITFIDTPGHAAFTKMRQRGASITDIVILVVAADDGVMPQTKESIRHIKQAGVPLIVAINKIDLKNAVPEMAKAQLVEEDIKVEGYGGHVPVVEISASTGVNVDKLLDTITVLAELEDLNADPSAPLEAVVIESSLNKKSGPSATLLIKQGTLRLGDEITSLLVDPSVTGKIKRLLSDTGQSLKQALPSTPVEVLGLRSVPPAGAVFTTLGNQDRVLASLPQLDQSPKPEPVVEVQVEAALDQPEDETAEPKTQPDPDQPIEEEEPEEAKPEINIILKADTKGSLEAIKQSLSEEVIIIDSGTGEIGESDVMLAQTTRSIIIGFNTAVSRSAQKLAQIEGVPIKTYDIIYKLLEDFESEVLRLLEPTIDETKLGEAKVLQIFTIKDQTIVGCKVISGAISLGEKVHLKRNDKIIADATISSLKQGKTDVKKVQAGDECGLVLKPASLSAKPDDVISAFKKAT